MCAMKVAATVTGVFNRIAGSFRQIKARLKYVTTVFSSGVCAVVTSTKIIPVQRPTTTRRAYGDIAADIAHVRAIDTAGQGRVAVEEMAIEKRVRHNKRFNPVTNDFEFERPLAPRENAGSTSTSDAMPSSNVAESQNPSGSRVSSISQSSWESDDGVLWKWDGDSVILDGEYVRAESPSPPPLAQEPDRFRPMTQHPLPQKMHGDDKAAMPLVKAFVPPGHVGGPPGGGKSAAISRVDKMHTAFQAKFQRADAARQSRFFKATEALHEKLAKEHREKLVRSMRRQRLMDQIPILSALQR